MAKHYSLDTVRQLLAFLGNPQEQFRAVHIAGTSGKTSTAYFMRELLQAAGQQTGLTISPHMHSITERVQINGQPLPDAQFLKYLNRFLPLITQSGLSPTYFEALVVFAYWVCAQEKVDYAVIETGLGGLLDGTNTIQRANKLCLITDIGLDHTEFLGSTITKIAEQKAGIIHPGNTVIMLPQSNKIMTVIRERAAAQSADLQIASLTPALNLPPYQQRNWSLARAAYRFLAQRDALPTLSPAALQQATSHVPPGRMEVLQIGNKTIILDGAHNPQKLRALRKALAARGVTRTAVLANLVKSPQSKINNALRVLKTFASAIIVPEFSVGQDLSKRHSLSPANFAKQARAIGLTVQPQADLSTALHLLLAQSEKTVVVTGSLYLVSAARELLMDQW
jgi:dihydrofolate synthase/folylpolyglutamate synthase